MTKFSFAHLMGRGSKAPAPAAAASAETDNKDNENENEGGDGEGEEEAGDEAEQDAQVQAAVRSAIAAERNRCASIFALPAAANNVAQAAELAFNSDMTAEQAAKVLSAAPKASGSDRLDRAMLGRSPNLGADRASEQPIDQAATAGWNRAVEMANAQLSKRK